MIYLYDSTETDFRYNGKPLPTAYDVTVSNTLNSEYYVMGKYPLDKDKVYKEIVEDRIIKVHTMDGMEPFRIVNVSKYELYVEFEAWPLFYADMRNKLVKPLNLKGVSGQTALNSFKNNLLIDTPFDFYSDITTNHDYHTQDVNERENNPKQLYNALDVFKTIVSRWGGELWIRGYDIRVNKRIGTDTEAMLYEKKNITEFVDTTNIEGIVTRLHGKSEWQDERQEGEEEGQKHSIEVTVDSPLINNYSGVVFEKQFTNNDIRTERELKNWLNLKFTTENIDKPQRTIEVGTNVIDETKIGFADTLILKYIKHDTDVRIKMVGYEYDGFANELRHVVLGQPKHTSSSTIGNTITDLVNNVVEPVDRNTTIAMNSADGKSTIFHGTADPNTLNLNAKENDTYFRTNGSEKEIWRFTGTLWELIIDTSETTKNAEDILEAKGIAEIARDNALNIATDLLEGTSFYKHTQDIGLASKNSDGTVNSIINLGSDGTAYIGGENIVLDGNTIVDGTFTITDKMIAPNAEIDGAKIGDATIGSAKIASLDASKISTGTLDGIAITGVTITGSTFIQESALTGSTYGRWDRYGITMRDPQGLLVMDMNRQGLNFSGSGLGHSGTYINNELIDVQNATIYNLNVTGEPARMKRALFDGNITVGSSVSGNNAGIIFNGKNPPTAYDRMIWAGFGSRGDGLYTYFNGWSKLQTEITNTSDITMNSLTTNSLTIGGTLVLTQRLSLRNAGLHFSGETIPAPVDRQMWIGYGYADNGIYVSMGSSWHKHGATISDERLKKNIVETATDSLTAIKSWEFVEFEWKDRGYGSGQQFGLIAQNTSHIASYYDEVDRWEIDTQKQTMMNSHAIQQLALREQNTNKVASQALQLGESNEEKIKRLEERIKELESVI